MRRAARALQPILMAGERAFRFGEDFFAHAAAASMADLNGAAVTGILLGGARGEVQSAAACHDIARRNSGLIAIVHCTQQGMEMKLSAVPLVQ